MSDTREDHSHIVGIIIVIVSLVSFLQTTTILSVIFTNKAMFRSSYHVLIGNLMVADLIVSIMGLFFRGPGLIDDGYAEGPFLARLCTVVPFMTWSALFCASLAVLCITYNRMLALINPLKYKANVTRSSSLKLVLFTWLAVIVYFVVAVIVFHGGLLVADFKHGCFFNTETSGQTFILACDTIFFVIPLAGILLMYSRIVMVMRRERLAAAHKKKDHLREAVFRNISFLLFFFTFSWFPNYYIELKVRFFPDFKRLLIIEDIAVIMFYSNLIIDPLVYGLGSRDFRGRVFHLLRLKFKVRRFSVEPEEVTLRKMSQASARISPRVSEMSVNNAATLRRVSYFGDRLRPEDYEVPAV